MAAPSVITTEPMTVAFISMRGPYAQTPEGFGRLCGWIRQRALQPVGMPAAVYLTMPSETPESEALWELWAPIAEGTEEVPPDSSGIGIKRVPATLAASAMHKGPYETVAPTYQMLWRWIGENGYAPAGPPMERYYSDPAEVPPEEYLTEIVMPVRKL